MRDVVWVNLLFPVLSLVTYLTLFVGGLPVRPGESRCVKDWLEQRRGRNAYPEPFKHFYCTSIEVAARAHDVAQRWKNPDGQPFVVLNLEHFGGPLVGGLLARRIRRLVDGVATCAGVPVFPIPFMSWSRVTQTDGEFSLVQRRGRECVFTKTVQMWGSSGDSQTEYFLSGFDRNEFPALYFLTQLPRPVTSIKDAREALKPRSVVLAQDAGRRVYRQGDMFAIPTSLSDQEIRDQGGKIREKGSLYGTAHTATRTAYLPNGTMLAQGIMRHDPLMIGAHRHPDHKRLKLKRNRWHVVAKNTTPMVKPPTPARTSWTHSIRSRSPFQQLLESDSVTFHYDA